MRGSMNCMGRMKWNSTSGLMGDIAKFDIVKLCSNVFPKEFRVLGKVSSPGLNLAVQSLLIGKSSLIGGEAWLPALVEALMIAGRKQGIFCH